MESAVPTRPVPAAGRESPEPPGQDPGPAPAHLPRRQLRKTWEAGCSKSESLQNFRSVVAPETFLRAAEIRRTGRIFHGVLSARSAPQAPEKVSAVLMEPQARDPALSSVVRSISADKFMGITSRLSSLLLAVKWWAQSFQPSLWSHVDSHTHTHHPSPTPTPSPLSGVDRRLSFLREKWNSNSQKVFKRKHQGVFSTKPRY